MKRKNFQQRPFTFIMILAYLLFPSCESSSEEPIFTPPILTVDYSIKYNFMVDANNNYYHRVTVLCYVITQDDLGFRCQIDWGDGSEIYDSGKNWVPAYEGTHPLGKTHMYNIPGNYSVRIKVTDQNNQSTEKTLNVEILAEPGE